MNSAQYIGEQVRIVMQLISAIDPYMPDEDQVEVLIGVMGIWGSIESELLFTALETVFEDAETVIAAARKRLNILYGLQSAIHDGEAADAPFTANARKYIDGIKYHLAADIQDMVPLAAQLPEDISQELAASMQAMKMELS